MAEYPSGVAALPPAATYALELGGPVRAFEGNGAGTAGDYHGPAPIAAVAIAGGFEGVAPPQGQAAGGRAGEAQAVQGHGLVQKLKAGLATGAGGVPQGTLPGAEV